MLVSVQLVVAELDKAVAEVAAELQPESHHQQVVWAGGMPLLVEFELVQLEQHEPD
jgi:hypothetical protein